MKNMTTRERVQTKLNSMASILLDNIIVPDSETQDGSETISASYYDHNGNKFTFVLGLTVTPKELAESSLEPVVTIDDKFNIILDRIGAIEAEVRELKAYHDTPAVEPDSNVEEES